MRRTTLKSCELRALRFGNRKCDLHGIGVHGLANEELVVAEVGNDLLGEALGTSLEFLDLVVAGATGLEGLLDLLHVGWGTRSATNPRLRTLQSKLTLEVTEVGFLVEAGLLETERVDNVDLGLLLVVGTLVVTALGRGVGAGVEALTTDGDLGAVGLIGDAVDGLQVVGVGDELIAADNVLR